MNTAGIDNRPEVLALLAATKAAMPELRKALEGARSEWSEEDGVYRFYHHSFKVYSRFPTLKIVELLRGLAPGRRLNADFLHIIDVGTAVEFSAAHNRDWPRYTRPILEAFFHARYMLEMAVKYGAELETPPAFMPSGWAAFLCLYNLR